MLLFTKNHESFFSRSKHTYFQSLQLGTKRSLDFSSRTFSCYFYHATITGKSWQRFFLRASFSTDYEMKTFSGVSLQTSIPHNPMPTVPPCLHFSPPTVFLFSFFPPFLCLFPPLCPQHWDHHPAAAIVVHGGGHHWAWFRVPGVVQMLRLTVIGPSLRRDVMKEHLTFEAQTKCVRKYHIFADRGNW